MMQSPNSPFRTIMHRRVGAFTVLEAMIALVITSLIMVALTYTSKAAIDSYRAIQDQAAMTLTGQVAMQRMTAQLRAGAVKDAANGLPAETAAPYPQDSYYTAFRLGTAVDTTGFTVCRNYVSYTFSYNATKHTVDCQRTDLTTNTASAWTSLVHNVSSFKVHLIPVMSLQTSSATVYNAIEVAAITMTLDPGAATGTVKRPMIFTATVFPRAANFQQTSLQYTIRTQ